MAILLYRSKLKKQQRSDKNARHNLSEEEAMGAPTATVEGAVVAVAGVVSEIGT